MLCKNDHGLVHFDYVQNCASSPVRLQKLFLLNPTNMHVQWPRDTRYHSVEAFLFQLSHGPKYQGIINTLVVYFAIVVLR